MSADYAEEARLPLAERIRAALGDVVVSTDAVRRARASSDRAHVSPILAERLPAGIVDLVVIPTSVDQIPELLRIAFEEAIPVTARGTGLGISGRAIPLRGGIVLDVSRCRRIIDISSGAVTAEAGVRMRDLDDAVAVRGQQLTIVPATGGCTLGGFLAGGSSGIGSLIHGTTSDGFVHALDVAPCDGSGRLRHVVGDECRPHVRAYGTTGVVTRATVALSPARTWVGVFAAFECYDDATAALCALARLRPLARLASLDEQPLVAALPADRGLDPDRVSVRVIAQDQALPEVRDLINRFGGDVLDERDDTGGGPARIAALSFHHSTFHLQRSAPDYFHLEVSGDPLWSNPEAVRDVFGGTLLHLDVMRDGMSGILMAPYVSASQVYSGMARLASIGVVVASTHSWVIDRPIDLLRTTLRRNDPRGLLNPGKLPRIEPDTDIEIDLTDEPLPAENQPMCG